MISPRAPKLKFAEGVRYTSALRPNFVSRERVGGKMIYTQLFFLGQSSFPYIIFVTFWRNFFFTSFDCAIFTISLSSQSAKNLGVVKSVLTPKRYQCMHCLIQSQISESEHYTCNLGNEVLNLHTPPVYMYLCS